MKNEPKMKANKISITSDALNELFRYEPETGKLFWRESGKGRKLGEDAGCLNKSDGYRQITISGNQYKVHRIIWLMTYGEIRQDMEIDHKDGVRDNNRIGNLRLVTKPQNQWNAPRAKGYSWHKPMKKWKARICANRQQVHLGYFNTKQDARSAYLKAKERYHQTKQEA